MSSSLLNIASGGSLVDLDGTFFIQLGIFFVMFIFLHFALFKPVMRMIAARREATEGTTQRALQMKFDASELADDVDGKLVDIRSSAILERNRIIDDAREREREILSNAHAAAHREMENARVKMQSSGDAVRDQLRKDVGQLADAVMSRMLKKVG
ncbi:MAG: ATP synthase F0 subunit B [Deltaproteobacteria bacterium]|nr:ATP synthase F0 subunit B [Deltaproteobacteria bacterium]